MHLFINPVNVSIVFYRHIIDYFHHTQDMLYLHYSLIYRICIRKVMSLKMFDSEIKIVFRLY